MDELDAVLEEVYTSLPEKPQEGEPVVLTARELETFEKNGMVTKHWRGGGISVIMTTEKRAEILKMLSS